MYEQDINMEDAAGLMSGCEAARLGVFIDLIQEGDHKLDWDFSKEKKH